MSARSSTAADGRSFDAVILGGSADSLIAAIDLARAGWRVLLTEASAELGDLWREIEFAPGLRAAPLAPCAETNVIALGDGEPLTLHGAAEQTAKALQHLSARDAQRWPAFCKQMDALSGFLVQLYRAPPPRIDANSLGEYLALANLARKFRGLGKADMTALMRTMPMSLADLLDDWFESDRLKGALAALGLTDLCQGPLSGGTAFAYLHRQAALQTKALDKRLQTKNGPAAVIAKLAKRAQAAGVTIALATSVKQILVRENRIAGVILEPGETIASRVVLSSLNPYRTLLELLDPLYLDPEFIHAVRHVRFRGVTTKILLGLDTLPAAATPGSSILLAPSMAYVERAYDAAKYGRCSEEPFLKLHFPNNAGAKPTGSHIAVLHVQYTPYQLREASWPDLRELIADRAFALLDRHLPGFSSSVRVRHILTPLDLEARFGLREGAPSHGELMLDQAFFMRPVPSCARYSTPIPGLYLCGPGAHPAIAGASGRLAAKLIARQASRAN